MRKVIAGIHLHITHPTPNTGRYSYAFGKNP